MSVSDCIFCKIVAGTSDCQEIYQDETTLALMDIYPANDGHCLVIPKAHFETVFDMPPAAFAGVGSKVAKVARAVNEVLQPGGVSLIQANGELAGQSVLHVHVHVLPRRTDDNLLILGSQQQRRTALRSRAHRRDRRASSFSPPRVTRQARRRTTDKRGERRCPCTR
jgi:histidine triad (HIT) family protein